MIMSVGCFASSCLSWEHDRKSYEIYFWQLNVMEFMYHYLCFSKLFRLSFLDEKISNFCECILWKGCFTHHNDLEITPLVWLFHFFQCCLKVSKELSLKSLRKSGHWLSIYFQLLFALSFMASIRFKSF